MSPVYICQNDKHMTSLALSTAHQVNTNLCQPHSLKSCHIFGKDLSKTCHPQYLFFAVDGSQVPIKHQIPKHFGNVSIYLVELDILSNKISAKYVQFLSTES